MDNKLLCTFSLKENLENTINHIKNKYSVIYKKIFILYCENIGEYLCTYNVDFGNLNGLIQNTILVHRKKHYNTLYTINALNTLIRQLNQGILDKSFEINWDGYRNCILLTRENKFFQLNTQLYNIVEL